MTRFDHLSVRSLAGLVRNREVKAVEIVGHCLDRMSATGSLGIVTWSNPEEALVAARRLDGALARGDDPGVLAGIPVLVKDNIDVAGYPTTAGAAPLRELPAPADAALVARLRAEGAVILGKVNMHELAMGGTSNNATYGRTRNPYAPDHVPGGSSGGSGAAVAARLAPIALGTDTAGSVRIPASSCGVAGWRPTVLSRQEKLLSDQGVVPAALDLDTIGPLARSVEDIAHIHRALGHRAAASRSDRLRIGRPSGYFLEQLEPPVTEAYELALGRLRSAGHAIVDVDLSAVLDIAVPGFFRLLNAGVREDIPAFLAERCPSIGMDMLVAGIRGADVRRMVDAALEAAADPEAEAEARTTFRQRARRLQAELFTANRLDAIAFPTCPILPPLHHTGDDPADTRRMIGNEEVSVVMMQIRNTLVASFLGAPAISLPIGIAPSGLPVGLELDGLPGEDAALLDTACRIESMVGRIKAPTI